ncbi:MAG: hypothetical protein MUC75_03075 [Ignavibacteriaceae bacterium]|nr:hypothetical protein [Ignavibacteriaceae bacterium]
MSAYSNVSDRIYSYLTSTFGEDAAKNYSHFIDENPAKYIRVNERRIKRETLATRLFNIYGIIRILLYAGTNFNASATSAKSNINRCSSGFMFCTGLENNSDS